MDVTNLQPIDSVKMPLHFSAPGLYTGQSAVQSEVDIAANLHIKQPDAQYCTPHAKHILTV